MPPLSLDDPAPAGLTRDVWSVSRLAREVGAVLGGSFPLLWVQGELTNLAQPASGHLYFTLKDEVAQVRCAMFKPKARLLRARPANGTLVLVRARVALYEPRGDFQLICEHLEPAGEGALRQELDARVRRLAAEGLFDGAAKRRPPTVPRQVGLITSPSGAAVHDLLTVLARRFPLLPVLIYPAQVQGEGAAAALCAALAQANRHGACDVLILARGGGALEDLMAFNDEALARAIRASAIPVVTGIGHEVDQTIADLAADQRAATPSAAAELVTPDGAALRARLAVLGQRLTGAAARGLTRPRERLGAALRQLRLLHPAARLRQQAQRLDDLERQLLRAVGATLVGAAARLAGADRRLAAAAPLRRTALEGARLAVLRGRLGRAAVARLTNARATLARLGALLDGLSPLGTLGRGYALVTRADDGALVRTPEQVAGGDLVRIRLAAGELRAEVRTPRP